MEKSSPGVMIYFDMRPCLKRLSLEEKGQLLDAILEYGELGVVPEADGVLGVAWDFVQQKIDKDKKRYERICEKKREAGRASAAKRANERQHTITNDNECQQTQPTATTTATTTESKAAEPPTRAPARRSFSKYGWVKLTDEEYNRLLSDLGEQELNRCISYIDEMAESTGNKNRWKNWNLVLRRCSRDGWGKNWTGKQQKNGGFLDESFYMTEEKAKNMVSFETLLFGDEDKEKGCSA